MTPRSLLQLFRIASVFTALADVVAGICLVRGGAFVRRDLALLGASGALYAADMVWNAYRGRRIDARERPERSTPAGELPRTAAVAIGMALLAVGLALAAGYGQRPLGVAVALAASISLYHGGLKNTALGPWTMGACRALNVGLGLSVVDGPMPRSVWLLPVVLGAFSLLIARLSRVEVGPTAPQRVRSTLWGFALLAAPLGPMLCWVIWTNQGDSGGALLTILTFGFLAARSVMLLAPLARDATTRTLAQAIEGCMLLMPALDAAFVAASGSPLAAVAIFVLAVPAFVLKRSDDLAYEVSTPRP